MAGRAGDDIRSFERKLKKGLRSVRMVTACRRKIDSLIIVVKNKKASLLRLKAEAKGKLSLYEKDMREVQLHEQTLRTTIQQEVARSQTFAEELAAIRAENTELEQEMLQAQNVEESTRLREASIEAQIESDRKRHDEVVTQSAAQIDDYQNVGNKVTSEQEVLAQHLEEKTKELLAAKRQIKKKLEEEGHNTSPITVDLEGPVPRFDRKRFEMAVEAEYNEVRAKTEVNGALRQLIEELRESLRNTKEETFRSQATASTLSDSVHAKKATETERRVGLESFENKLERDRAEVSRLEKSSKDLEDIRAEATSRHLQLVSECSAVIRNDQRLIETVKRDLEIKSNETERKNVSWEKGKSELSSRVEKAKRRAEITGEALDNYKKKADEREVENTKNFQETIRQIEESRKSHEEKSTRQISKLTKSKLSLDYWYLRLQ